MARSRRLGIAGSAMIAAVVVACSASRPDEEDVGSASSELSTDAGDASHECRSVTLRAHHGRCEHGLHHHGSEDADAEASFSPPLTFALPHAIALGEHNPRARHVVELSFERPVSGGHHGRPHEDVVCIYISAPRLPASEAQFLFCSDGTRAGADVTASEVELGVEFDGETTATVTLHEEPPCSSADASADASHEASVDAAREASTDGASDGSSDSSGGGGGGDSSTCSPASCDDGLSCTDDSCGSSGCTHTAKAPGTVCGGDLCTGLATCAGTTCVPGAPAGCPPSTECAASSCDPLTGCKVTPAAAGTPCGGADRCSTGRACDGAGACTAGTPVTCNSHNPCIIDACDPNVGCSTSFAPVGTSCATDDNHCNGDEVCGTTGQCLAGAPP